MFMPLAGGPLFVPVEGKSIEWPDQMPDKEGKMLMEFCIKFYDDFGAANERISLTS